MSIGSGPTPAVDTLFGTCSQGPTKVVAEGPVYVYPVHGQARQHLNSMTRDEVLAAAR